MSNRRFCQLVFAVGVLFSFCIPCVASRVTYKPNIGSMADLWGPQGQVSSNWFGNTAGAVRSVCFKSNGIGYLNLLYLFKPKPKPPSPVVVADGDPSSLVLLAVGLTGLLVTAVVARLRTRT